VNPVGLGQPDTRAVEVRQAEHGTHVTFMVVSAVIAIVGIGLAYQLHLKKRSASDELAERMFPVATTLEHKYWIDELYQAMIVEPLRSLGRVFYAFDRIVVEGLVWLIGFVPQFSGFTLKLTTQRGYLQGYAGGMVLGILVILLIVFL
jgi:NADH-quinone oxidoreductase subunit L